MVSIWDAKWYCFWCSWMLRVVRSMALTLLDLRPELSERIIRGGQCQGGRCHGSLHRAIWIVSEQQNDLIILFCVILHGNLQKIWFKVWDRYDQKIPHKLFVCQELIFILVVYFALRWSGWFMKREFKYNRDCCYIYIPPLTCYWV